MALGDQFCHVESAAVRDPTFWTFTVGMKQMKLHNFTDQFITKGRQGLQFNAGVWFTRQNNCIYTVILVVSANYL